MLRILIIALLFGCAPLSAHAGPAAKVGGKVAKHFFKNIGKKAAPIARGNILGRRATQTGRRRPANTQNESTSTFAGDSTLFILEETGQNKLQDQLTQKPRPQHDFRR